MSLSDKLIGVDPGELAQFLVDRKSVLPQAVKNKLGDAFGLSKSVDTEDIDLRSEVTAQLAAVKSLRESAVSPEGRLLIGTRDAKEALSAATSLLKLLNSLQTEIYNADRVRVLQKTTIDVLKEVDPALQSHFLRLLDERLKDL